MPRCKSCWYENRDGATTCRRCGTRIDAKKLSATPPVMTVAARARAEKRAARMTPEPSAPERGRMISVSPSGKDTEVYRLDDDQIDIGREEGHIRIDDPQLARRHARLNLTPGGALLTPLDRRNGVYLRLRATVDLVDGDHILLGRQVLRFETVPEHEQRVRPSVEDGVVLFGTPAPRAWARLRQLTSSGVGRDLYHLSRSHVTLGREHADLVFADDEFLSRRHAQLAFLSEKSVLQDLGSSNGTYLRLRAPQVLGPGDMIRLGDQLLRFELG